MWSIAYILFLSLGWMKQDFSIEVFILLIITDIVSIPLSMLGKAMYEWVKVKVRGA